MVFEEIYKIYWQKIYRLCMGYVNNTALAQDMAQETFIIVWQQLANFREEANIGTWIYRIASNNCLRQIEKQKRLLNIELPIEIEDVKLENSDPELEFLYKCIAELPETDRIIISLELEDLKQADIASIVGLSEANVRVKIHRIKEKLIQKFKEIGD